MELQITEEKLGDLQDYAAVPIAFTATRRLNLDQLWLGEIAEVVVEPYEKDYDALESPLTLAERFDVSQWVVLKAAQKGKTRMIGGAILALKTPGLDMLDGRDDLAVLWDIRVHPLSRGHGVGRKLFKQASAIAKRNGCIELRVETQDTNVDACKFYRRMGCRIHGIHENAYEGLDETKLIWSISLRPAFALAYVKDED